MRYTRSRCVVLFALFCMLFVIDVVFVDNDDNDDILIQQESSTFRRRRQSVTK